MSRHKYLGGKSVSLIFVFCQFLKKILIHVKNFVFHFLGLYGSIASELLLQFLLRQIDINDVWSPDELNDWKPWVDILQILGCYSPPDVSLLIIHSYYIIIQMFSGHELQVVENGIVPRPEEERITQAEKNERINAQLKVRRDVQWSRSKASLLIFMAWTCKFSWARDTIDVTFRLYLLLKVMANSLPHWLFPADSHLKISVEDIFCMFLLAWV